MDPKWGICSISNVAKINIFTGNCSIALTLLNRCPHMKAQANLTFCGATENCAGLLPIAQVRLQVSSMVKTATAS